MRLLRLAAGDIRFQWKYGFYLLYAVFTAFYLLTLAAVPENMRRIAAAVMIFTDPAAMGLFFMGAVILLEKSQRVNHALAVSPIWDWEYMLSKLLSFAALGLLVAGILAVAGGITNLPLCLLAVMLASFLFSACGLIAAERSRSLNQFVLLAVPFELLICLPPVLLLFGFRHSWLMLHPGIAAVWLIYGEAPSVLLCLLALVLWCIPALYFCRRSVGRYLFRTKGASV